MAKKTSAALNAKGTNKPREKAVSATLGPDSSRQFFWDVASINIHLDQIRKHWAKVLGITGPQWMILVAVADLDQGGGVPVKDVIAKLLVDPSFVTVQSKILEKSGLLHRTESAEDARVVLMSLTEKATREMEALSVRQELLNKFIFSDSDPLTLSKIMTEMSNL